MVMFVTASIVVVCVSAVNAFCSPGEACWPSDSEVNTFKASVTGDVILPDQSDYANVTGLFNLWYTRQPKFVVMVESEVDVQKSVLFAGKHRLRISILGTGHDFIGRSTSDNSLMINSRKMKNITVYNNMTHESGYVGPAGRMAIGNQWGGVYKELDKHGYIIAGGSSPTVGMGGYTSGGGHSPMTRILGLAVDNVLEFTIVLADGRSAKATKSGVSFTDQSGNTAQSSDSDLFWAVRGGGGSTFGVLTSILFKLHTPPTTFVHMYCAYTWYSRDSKLNYGDQVLKNYFKEIQNLPKEWGGYVIFDALYSNPFLVFKITGSVTFYMLYSGHSYEHAMETIKPISGFYPGYRTSCTMTNHTSFWSYQKNIYDAKFFSIYITNILLPKTFDADKLQTMLTKNIMPADPQTEQGVLTCTGTLTGGRSEDYSDDSASVSTYLRHGLNSLTCATGWEPKDVQYKDYLIKQVQALESDMRSEFGPGVYYNEPPYYLDDWQKAYWGDNYARLLSTKNKYDPHGNFTCFHCVGDTGGYGVASTTRAFIYPMLLLVGLFAYL